MNKLMYLKRSLSFLTAAVMLTLCACGAQEEDQPSPPPSSQQSAEKVEEIEESVEESSEEEKETEPEETEPPETEPEEEQTLENNNYFVGLETLNYPLGSGGVMIVKVRGKQNCKAKLELTLFGEDDRVLTILDDTITLTEGEENYFSYVLDPDSLSLEDGEKWRLESSFTATEDFTPEGQRKAVELENYNMSGDNLYLTFKQTGDEVGYLSKFKLLFYKDDQLIHSDDEYFCMYVDGLVNKGDTDIAELYMYRGKDFDRLEYFYEP